MITINNKQGRKAIELASRGRASVIKCLNSWVLVVSLGRYGTGDSGVSLWNEIRSRGGAVYEAIRLECSEEKNAVFVADREPTGWETISLLSDQFRNEIFVIDKTRKITRLEDR